MSEEHIGRYTTEQLRKMREQGLSQTDWARVDAMTEEELERSIAEDPDWKDIPRDWVKDAIPWKPGQELLSLNVDTDMLQWFRAQGPDYLIRMNQVLREHMRARSTAPQKPQRRRA